MQVSTKLNRSHLVHGATGIILPSLGRTDTDLRAGRKQVVTVEDSMSVVHLSRGGLTPASAHLRSEVAIVCELAQHLFGPAHPVPWARFADDYDSIRDAIARVIPGFDDFNTRVRQPDGFVLPHPPRDERRFTTATGKATFVVNDLHWLPVPDGRVILQTLRSHDQYNTTIYGLDDRYRGITAGRRVLFINARDIDTLGFVPGQRVDLVSEWTRPDGTVEERRAEDFRLVPYPTPIATSPPTIPKPIPSSPSITWPANPTPRSPRRSPSASNPTRDPRTCRKSPAVNSIPLLPEGTPRC